MTGKVAFLTEQQLELVGQRYGSDAVNREANEALARWRRDLPALEPYGFSQSRLDEFAAILVSHGNLRSTRPESVIDKKMAVVERDRKVSLAWAWADKVVSVLGLLARTDQQVATALATARPTNDAALEPGIRALASILADCRDRLPAAVQADKRLEEVAALSAGLQASPATLHTSKGQTKADTTQLDILDGKLCTAMADLNAAARKAIRNGDLAASPTDYTFHHLNRSGNANRPAPAPEPPPPGPVAKP
jgi:hypothetical protein